MTNPRGPDRRATPDPLFGPLQLLVLRHLPLVLRSLVYGLGLLLVAMGVQIIWPGARVANLEAADKILIASDLVTNSRVDSLATVLRGHLTDEAITRRATQIWLCLHSEPAEQDMLQLPCTLLIQNASRRPRRGRFP